MDDRVVRVRVLVGSRIFTSPYCPYRHRGPPNFLSNGYRGKSNRGVKLTTHLQLVLRSRKRGSMYPLPNMPSWCSIRTKLLSTMTAKPAHSYFAILWPIRPQQPWVTVVVVVAGVGKPSIWSLQMFRIDKNTILLMSNCKFNFMSNKIKKIKFQLVLENKLNNSRKYTQY
jgi:hypothetical protein